ncbi:ABC transporter permease [Polyangium spumosum]|uniref:Transport permease protein n=1 Tax=Polyangium spumosum TaxID=889282 RepID=A0A6N7Q2L3_9BACT|nr:ABC transporter permease [Polyangium spumosum]MRG95161.1 ABC transporter permease subunit [Polyangium spumosum]
MSMHAEVVYHLARRDVVKFLRDRQNVAATLVRPLLWILAVGFGLRRAFDPGATGVDFVSFLVPGVATMAVLFSSMFSAISIVWDREFGFLKELLVAPVPRATLVFAKMIAASVTALFEVSVVLLVSPLLGARIDPLGALLSIPVLVAFGMAVSALGITVASRMKTFEGFGGIVNFLIQPVFFFSGALYPLEGLPPALSAVVRLNPMSYAVDATRGLCVGVHHFPIALDAAVVLGTLVVLGALAVRSFSRMQA